MSCQLYAHDAHGDQQADMCTKTAWTHTLFIIPLPLADIMWLSKLVEGLPIWLNMHLANFNTVASV